MFNKIKKIHIVGIGGIGMSSIADVLFHRGYQITGSDKSFNDVTERLQKIGIKVYAGHSANNLANDVDVLVYSSAVAMDNPELAEALKRKIPVVKRPEMLAEIMRTQYGVCIAGTHGKTTTTSMTGLILVEGNLDPTIIVGGNLNALGNTNARVGKGEFIVVEADEFDRTFLSLTPAVAALTSLEAEHLDTYKDLEDIKSAFIEFANKISFYGFIALCSDDPNLRSIIPLIKKKIITYGINEDADVRATGLTHREFSSEFSVNYLNENLGKIKLNIPGTHNINNSLAAIIIAKELGVGFGTIKKSIESFKGALRRFEIKYDKKVLVIDDYAHHPTEVAATLDGIRKGWNRRLIAVFQPHLYSRTRDFAGDFGKAFLNSDVFICTDVYPSREAQIAGITGKLITDAVKNEGHQNVLYEADKNNIPELLMKIKQDGDIIITMGAGDIYKYGEKFVQLIEEHN
ncbi:MAG: UDP-N-acetylmuramate--L-alanine ligase [Ignavibacteriales bacterium]|nr:UDP-N-acetylmuramate--L-alanine ligase [Ignavibacteriales bacterium]